MKFLRNTSVDPYFNMAFDEFCLERLFYPEPLFYLWKNRPSVIVGLNQNVYSEVNLKYLEESGTDLVRRVTGGGAVYHDLKNLNYSIVGRASDLENGHPRYMLYMTEALRELGVDVQLSGRNDILVDGKKVSGYAKRVFKDRVMIHGTLMYDVDLEALGKALAVPGSKLGASGIASVHSKVANLKDFLPGIGSVDELAGALEPILAGNDSEVHLSENQLIEIGATGREKFSSWEWIYGKSPQADFRVFKKFACGTVGISFSITHGILENVRFDGDFLGNLDTGGLEKALQGCKYTKGCVEEILKKEKVSRYFDSLDAEDISSLIFDRQAEPDTF